MLNGANEEMKSVFGKRSIEKVLDWRVLKRKGFMYGTRDGILRDQTAHTTFRQKKEVSGLTCH